MALNLPKQGRALSRDSHTLNKCSNTNLKKKKECAASFESSYMYYGKSNLNSGAT